VLAEAGLKACATKPCSLRSLRQAWRPALRNRVLCARWGRPEGLRYETCSLRSLTQAW